MTIGDRNKIIIDMRNAGHHYDDIMQRLGCRRSVISNVLHEYKTRGMAAARSKRTIFKDKEARNEDIMRMFDDGKNMSEIAEEIGMSVSAVSRIISKDKPVKVKPEPVMRSIPVVHVGDTVMFLRDREQIIGKVKALNKHTVTITIDHGRFKETCCPNYTEIEVVL